MRKKILQLQVKQEFNIRFIDSLSFILMPLKAFPKTSGLNELCKGYIPHYFNKQDNQNYVGAYPHQKDYGYLSMTRSA